jgi:hypothetical protein
VAGGQTTPIRTGTFATAAIGGIAVDDTSVYAAVVASKTEIRILRAAK